jgi:hypothetical protein
MRSDGSPKGREIIKFRTSGSLPVSTIIRSASDPIFFSRRKTFAPRILLNRNFLSVFCGFTGLVSVGITMDFSSLQQCPEFIAKEQYEQDQIDPEEHK